MGAVGLLGHFNTLGDLQEFVECGPKHLLHFMGVLQSYVRSGCYICCMEQEWAPEACFQQF